MNTDLCLLEFYFFNISLTSKYHQSQLGTIIMVYSVLLVYSICLIALKSNKKFEIVRLPVLKAQIVKIWAFLFRKVVSSETSSNESLLEISISID